jgi:Na+-driven multidrug efflux pump
VGRTESAPFRRRSANFSLTSGLYSIVVALIIIIIIIIIIIARTPRFFSHSPRSVIFADLHGSSYYHHTTPMTGSYMYFLSVVIPVVMRFP